MNLKELHSFKLSDAVKFHDKLNPKLFHGQHLDSIVKKKLLVIAEDFLSELGISDLKVKDITVSGSNAAYSYTPHSDLDLHILVDMNELDNNEVYKELFTAKKNIYNDTHDIKVKDIPVELYIQDSNLPVVSLGEYSLLQNKWLRLPTKRRANLDQTVTKSKYEKLKSLADRALQSRSLPKIKKAIDKIKKYRRAGLDKAGEFGPENLAYKMLRTQGYIQKLFDLRDKLHSEKLSFETMYQNPLKQDVTENFNQPYPIKWEKSEVGNSQDALATLADGTSLSIMFNDVGDEEWQVEFYRNNSQRITGKGDSQRVFATVLNAISKFIKKNKPSTLFFGLVRQEDPKGSRTKLYDRLVQKYANQLGYDVNKVEHPETTDFNLIRKDQSVTEASGAKQVVLEYDRNITAQKIGPVNLVSKLNSDRTLKTALLRKLGKLPMDLQNLDEKTILSLAHNILGMIEQQDPTQHKEYTPWLARVYANTDLKFEDLNRHNTLGMFDVGKRRKLINPEDRDINRYKTYKEFETAMSKYDYNTIMRTKQQEINKGNAEEVFNDDTLRIIVPKDEAAACYYGQGTTWCTAATRSDNKFKDYQEGPLYILIPKQPKRHGEKYQLYFPDWEFMDERDNNVDLEQLVKRFPSLKTFLPKVEPSFANKLMFMDQTKLVPIVKQCLQIVKKSLYHNLKLDKKRTEKKYNLYKEYLSYLKGLNIQNLFNNYEIDLAYDFPETVADWIKWHILNKHNIQLRFMPKFFRDAIYKLDDYELELDTDKNGNYILKSKPNQVQEASGYIPSKAQSNDPRFKTALTVDVKPDSIKKNAKAFGFKTSRAGIPPQARPDGKF